MKYILLFSMIISFCACGDDAFINHELKAERSGACGSAAVPVKMISNINGERYEFHYCLGEDFDGKNYRVVRSGDSLLVKSPGQGNKTTDYKITLDIDAKPAYHFITLGDGGTTIPIKAAERL